MKSLEDIQIWLGLRRIDAAECLVGRLDIENQPFYQRILVGLVSSVVGMATAAGNCLDLLNVELPNLKAQLLAADNELSEKALDTLIRSITKNINRLDDAGVQIQRSDTIRMFGQIAQRVGAAELNKFTKRWVSWPIAPPRTWSDPEFVSTLDDYIDVFSRVPSDIGSYKEWARGSLATQNFIQGAYSEALVIGRRIERLKADNGGVLPRDAVLKLDKKTEVAHEPVKGKTVEKGSESVDFDAFVNGQREFLEVKQMTNYKNKLPDLQRQFLKHMDAEVLFAAENRIGTDSVPTFHLHLNTAGGVDVDAETVANDLWNHLRDVRPEVLENLERAGFEINKDNVILFSDVLPPISDKLQ